MKSPDPGDRRGREPAGISPPAVGKFVLRHATNWTKSAWRSQLEASGEVCMHDEAAGNLILGVKPEELA